MCLNKESIEEFRSIRKREFSEYISPGDSEIKEERLIEFSLLLCKQWRLRSKPRVILTRYNIGFYFADNNP